MLAWRSVPTFIGLDLAWTAHRRNVRAGTGFCLLEGESPDDLRCTHIGARPLHVGTLAESVARVADRAASVIVASDAPLLFPPDTALERPVDAEAQQRFRRYKVRVLSARAAREKDQRAGIELARALEERGFTLDPTALLAGERTGRVAFEVFPHTLHVRLFGLTERLLYKHGDDERRRRGLRGYQRRLRELVGREAPGMLANPDASRALDQRTAATAEGAALKRLDDTLDGITCALAAWLAWRDPEAWEMLGDGSGHMVMPRERKG